MAKSNVSAISAPAPAHQEVAAVWAPTASLKRWDKNPRKNDPAVAAVVKSIKRFGFGAPIIARKADGEIIAGHTRHKAAEVLGLEQVPVRFLDLDPAEAHLLAIADNKLNEKAEWDEALVASILSDYSLEDAALAGFDSAELDKMAADVAGDRTQEPLDEDRYRNQYAVNVVCANEQEQQALYERLVAEGLDCRVVVT